MKFYQSQTETEAHILSKQTRLHYKEYTTKNKYTKS